MRLCTCRAHEMSRPGWLPWRGEFKGTQACRAPLLVFSTGSCTFYARHRPPREATAAAQIVKAQPSQPCQAPTLASTAPLSARFSMPGPTTTMGCLAFLKPSMNFSSLRALSSASAPAPR